MSALETQREYQRMLFEEYQEYLASQGYEASVEEGYGSYELVVNVPCPSEITANFSATFYEDEEGKPIDIYGNCSLAFSNELVTESWTIASRDSAEDICNDLIIEFINNCAYKEFSAVVKAEIINDSNLDNFINLLSDEALTEEGEFAVGFRIEDEAGQEIAAAASFFFTEDELVVDHIAISDNYEIPGFEQYIANYIYETVTVDEE